MPEDPREHAPDRRRAAIDAGRTGDKVPVADPAAAPFATDAEAQGVPTDSVAADRDRAEQERLAGPAAPQRAIRAGSDPAARPRAGVVLPIIGVLIVAAAVALGIVLVL